MTIKYFYQRTRLKSGINIGSTLGIVYIVELAETNPRPNIFSYYVNELYNANVILFSIQNNDICHISKKNGLLSAMLVLRMVSLFCMTVENNREQCNWDAVRLHRFTLL